MVPQGHVPVQHGADTAEAVVAYKRDQRMAEHEPREERQRPSNEDADVQTVGDSQGEPCATSVQPSVDQLQPGFGVIEVRLLRSQAQDSRTGSVREAKGAGVDFMRTKEQEIAYKNPLIGRDGEAAHTWMVPPFRFGLTFNR